MIDQSTEIAVIRAGLAELQDVVARINEEKGWNEDDEVVGEIVYALGSSGLAPAVAEAKIRQWLAASRLALIAGEVSEAMEELRSGREPDSCYYVRGNEERPGPPPGEVGDWKPEGVLIELADAVIRICHFFDRVGMPLADAVTAKLLYNQTRPYRHGGKAL